MGWYHSHPFEVGVHSHCFLSQTDISTQLQWQRAEDPHGNPFLAVVVDPLRSLAKNTPVLKAFRAYPPEYTHPIPNTCPDGSVIHEERGRLEQWGSCWNAYYELQVEYFMSSGARNVMSLLTQIFLWMRTLGTSVMLEGETRGRYPERLEKAAERLRRYDVNSNAGGGGGTGADVLHPDFEQTRSASGGSSRGRATSTPRSTVGGTGGSQGGPSSGTTGAKGGSTNAAAGEGDGGELGKACQALVDIATEKLIGNIAQVSKRELFS
jgi:COP9 signalosome complex subunit 5